MISSTITSIPNDLQDRARELAGTIREALVYLVERESEGLCHLLGDALESAEAAVAGHAGVRAACDALRTLVQSASNGTLEQQTTLAALDRFDRALTQALQPPPDVKLVIWDLDDTFWHGTLAEGDTLVIPPEHADMVRELTRRGIVNAICSKNDFAAAQSRLEQAGVWDQFIFPRIEYAPKGQLIRDIIKRAQLRAENVLFIDDNGLNLEEARYYNPGLQTLDAKLLHNLLSLPGLVGKPDDGKRLAQYKLLEQRANERSNASNNDAFLRQSDIRVRITPTQAGDAERVQDMLTRTNQLNFTKQRLSLPEVQQLIADPSRETATIAARDRFGDHGVVGWYCLHQGTLEHFLFSCRIINLGIEQFVYEHLGRPRLSVVDETASSPFASEALLDYITLEAEAPVVETRAQANKDYRKLRVYASGACDMYYLVGTLANALTDVTFDCNTFRGATRGVNVATEYLRSCFEMTDEDKEFCARHFHNYTGQTAFRPRIFDSGDYDYALFSFNDDADLFIYRQQANPNLRVVLSESAAYSVTPVRSPAGQDADTWLCEHFDCEGLITPERFRENLLWIAERMPSHTHLLLMTLPEYDYFRDTMPTFPQYRRQCIRLNRVIRDLCAFDARFSLVEMNNYITDRNHFTDYVMHLRPEPAFRIACAALQQMATHPTQYDILERLPTRGRRIALLGNGLEILPYFYALTAAGVAVSVCASKTTGVMFEPPNNAPDCIALSTLSGKAGQFFAIVTPPLAASGDPLGELGYKHGDDGWMLPETTFNLDWKER